MSLFSCSCTQRWGNTEIHYIEGAAAQLKTQSRRIPCGPVSVSLEMTIKRNMLSGLTVNYREVHSIDTIEFLLRDCNRKQLQLFITYNLKNVILLKWKCYKCHFTSWTQWQHSCVKCHTKRKVLYVGVILNLFTAKILNVLIQDWF